MRQTRSWYAIRPGCTAILVMSAAISLSTLPLKAGDRPYDEYKRSEIDEGLNASTAHSVADRVQGAVLVAMQMPFARDKAETGSADYWSSTSARIRAWIENDREPWVRYHLIKGLARLDEASDRLYLLAFLEDSDPTLRRLAAEFAAEHPSEETGARLVSLYSQQDIWWVRASFLDAMRNQGGDAALQLLHQALSDPSRDVRASASRALASRADPRSIKPLLAAVETAGLVGEDSPVRALAFIGGDAVLPAMRAAVSSPFPFERKQAAWGLQSFPLADSMGLLTKLLHRGDSSDARAAAEALISFNTAETAEEVLLYLATYSEEQRKQLQEGWDPVFEDLRGVKEKGVDLGAVCEKLMQRVPAGSALATGLGILGNELHRRASDGLHAIWSSGDLHSAIYSPFNADAREVAPAHGSRRAVAWEDAPLKSNGGRKAHLDRGAQVTVWAAALYQGEIWLEVSEGPARDSVWIREVDVQPLDPREVLDRSKRRAVIDDP